MKPKKKLVSCIKLSSTCHKPFLYFLYSSVSHTSFSLNKMNHIIELSSWVSLSIKLFYTFCIHHFICPFVEQSSISHISFFFLLIKCTIHRTFFLCLTFHKPFLHFLYSSLYLSIHRIAIYKPYFLFLLIKCNSISYTPFTENMHLTFFQKP